MCVYLYNIVFVCMSYIILFTETIGIGQFILLQELDVYYINKKKKGF